MSHILVEWFFNSLASIIITCGCVFALIIYLYCKEVYSFWKKKGIKGPEPWIVLGNVPEMMFRSRVDVELEWVAKYGKVYGIYLGLTPILVVADPETLTQICVKDFDAFPNHESKSEFWDKYGLNFIFNAADDNWKKMRYHLTPTFTSSKLKRMFTILDNCSNDTVACASEQLGKGGGRAASLNAKDLFELHTMNGVLSCCFGLKLNRGSSTAMKDLPASNEFAHASIKMFKIAPWRFMALFMFPDSILRTFGFTFVKLPLVETVARMIKNHIRQRVEADSKLDDYLQLLLDANQKQKEFEEHDDEVTSKGDAIDPLKTGHLEVDNELKSTKLTELEVLGNAVYLVGVANETSTSLLVSSVYFLAFHKNVQERLYKEISKIIDYSKEDTKKANLNYDALMGCHYLDAVVSESLRMSAPILHTVRAVKKEYHLKKYNIILPVGLNINLALHAVQNDPDFWINPGTFDPERFMPENKEKIVHGSFIPFGIGPRYCLGMRFALLEVKLALAKIVANFKLEPSPGTVFPPKFELHLATQIITKPFVQFIARDAQ